MTSYTIGKTRQLIQLNEGNENFELSFQVNRTSQRGEFYGVILDEQNAKSEMDTTFQPSNNGMLTGQMTWNQNIPKKFFLVLYADEPLNVSVDIKMSPLSPVKEEQKEVEVKETFDDEVVPPKKKRGFLGYLKIFLIIAMIGVGAYLLYRYFTKPKVGTAQFTQVALSDSSCLVESPVRKAKVTKKAKHVSPVQSLADSGASNASVHSVHSVKAPNEVMKKSSTLDKVLSSDLKARIRNLPLAS